MPVLSIVGCWLIGLACSSPEAPNDYRLTAVLTGLDGRAFFYPAVAPEIRQTLDSQVLVATKNLADDPSEANYIWLGRRLAYAYRYQDAIDTFSAGLRKFPQSCKLLRHRGHRYITLRQFDAAIDDLQQAAQQLVQQNAPLEIEPDGIPNRINQPLSSTQFNIYYHLALAQYLQGDWAAAEKTWHQCMAWCNNDDLTIAATDWLYMTLMRQGRKTDAASLLSAMPSQPTIIENDSYWQRLRLYQGKLAADSLLAGDTTLPDYDLVMATQGYGVANWYLVHGDTTRALALMKQVVGGKYFSAFGFIAAEADINRIQKD